ncbi:TPR end-of-group domain-containing protein [Hymenobacter koreensis]|uniref:Tetratricopeptide repeat protein n=1 Tax=Hymenobacter koreensis TaxID=1084523 RepID=A0ABP8JAS3_9BACT
MKYVVVSAFLALVLAAAPVAVRAQSADAISKHQAVLGTYPTMMHAIQVRDLAKARALCQQIIAYEPRESIHRYNLACIEALDGKREAGFAALRQATSLGYSDVNGLRSDPDLALLRADKRFEGVAQATTRNAIASPVPRAAPRPAPAAPAKPAPRPAPARSAVKSSPKS